jgi:hypothetical protein
MENFIKAMKWNVFLSLKQKFPRIRNLIMSERIFIGPKIRKLKSFNWKWKHSNESTAVKVFESNITIMLGQFKAEKYESLAEEFSMLKSQGIPSYTQPISVNDRIILRCVRGTICYACDSKIQSCCPVLSVYCSICLQKIQLLKHSKLRTSLLMCLILI